MAASPKIERWRQWKGKHRFFCNGKVMLGPEVSSLGLTLSLIVLSWVVLVMAVLPLTPICLSIKEYSLNSYIEEPIALIYHYVIPVAMSTMNVSMLFATALTEPGILPRRKSTVKGIIKSHELKRYNRTLYCQTCNIVRPERSRHCRFCDCCVSCLDHHCPWLGTCIGVRNYRYFLVFVISVVLSITFFIGNVLWVLEEWWLHGSLDGLATSMSRSRRALYAMLVIAGLFLYLAFFLFASSLLAFHCYLISNGNTTAEFLTSRRPGASPPSLGNPVRPVTEAAATGEQREGSSSSSSSASSSMSSHITSTTSAPAPHAQRSITTDSAGVGGIVGDSSTSLSTAEEGTAEVTQPISEKHAVLSPTSSIKNTPAPPAAPKTQAGTRESGGDYSLLQGEEEGWGIPEEARSASVDIEDPPSKIPTSTPLTSYLASCASSTAKLMSVSLLYLAPPASLVPPMHLPRTELDDLHDESLALDTIRQLREQIQRYRVLQGGGGQSLSPLNSPGAGATPGRRLSADTPASLSLSPRAEASHRASTVV